MASTLNNSQEATRTSRNQTEKRKYQPFVLCVVMFAAGILSEFFVAKSFLIWLASALIGLLLWRFAKQKGFHALATGSLCIAIFSTGATWHHVWFRLYAPDDVGRYAQEHETPVALEFKITSAPEFHLAKPFDPLRSMPSEPYSKMDIQAVRIRKGSEWIAVSGRATLTVSGEQTTLQSGDHLRGFGQLKAPSLPSNPGQPNFAWYAYAERNRASIRVQSIEHLTLLNASDSRNLLAMLTPVREHGQTLLNDYLPQETAGLAGAILLGERNNLTDQQTEQFIATGTIHLFAISGLHVGILAAVLFFALRAGFLPKRSALTCVIVLVICYTMITFARPPVVRSCMLVIVVCGGLWLHRQPFGLNTLAAAALLILAWNPCELFKVGTQLSFLAVTAMIAFSPWLSKLSVSPQYSQDPLQRLIEQTRPWPLRMTRSVVVWGLQLTLMGAIVWGVTSPLVMYHFHIFSPSTVFLNALLWVPVAISLVSGFGILVCGDLLPWLANGCGFVCNHCLQLLLWSTESISKIEGSFQWTCGPSVWWVVGFYSVLGIFLTVGVKWFPLRWFSTFMMGWVAIGLTAPTTVFAARLPANLSTNQAGNSQQQLKCTFLDVGHGLSVLLELPNGKSILYDAGHLGTPESVSQTVSHVLWSKQISHLDAVILSHADVDHYNAIPELIKRFSVQAVYMSPEFTRGESRSVDALMSALRERKIPVVEIVSGDQLKVGGDCQINVLHPDGNGDPEEDNSNSIVLGVEYENRKILLTGDLAPPGLYQFLFGPRYECDVLLAPHHGSPASQPWAMAKWATPKWVIISRGHQPKESITQSVYEELEANVFVTDKQGAIEVTIDKTSLSVQSWKNTRQSGY